MSTMEAKLDKLMEEVQQSREEVRHSRREAEASKKELEDKFASSISELNQEISVAQEKASQQLRGLDRPPTSLEEGKWASLQL